MTLPDVPKIHQIGVKNADSLPNQVVRIFVHLYRMYVLTCTSYYGLTNPKITGIQPYYGIINHTLYINKSGRSKLGLSLTDSVKFPTSLGSFQLLVLYNCPFQLHVPRTSLGSFQLHLVLTNLKRNFPTSDFPTYNFLISCFFQLLFPTIYNRK